MVTAGYLTYKPSQCVTKIDKVSHAVANQQPVEVTTLIQSLKEGPAGAGSKSRPVVLVVFEVRFMLWRNWALAQIYI